MNISTNEPTYRLLEWYKEDINKHKSLHALGERIRQTLIDLNQLNIYNDTQLTHIKTLDELVSSEIMKPLKRSKIPIENDISCLTSLYHSLTSFYLKMFFQKTVQDIDLLKKKITSLKNGYVFNKLTTSNEISALILSYLPQPQIAARSSLNLSMGYDYLQNLHCNAVAKLVNRSNKNILDPLKSSFSYFKQTKILDLTGQELEIKTILYTLEYLNSIRDGGYSLILKINPPPLNTDSWTAHEKMKSYVNITILYEIT